MPDNEQKLNDHEPPMQGSERGSGSSLAFVVLFVACISMLLLSVAVSGHAFLKILNTTGINGIPVDALGKRIPVQGYPQLGFGLSGVLLFSILAAVVGLRQAMKNNEELHL